eukprot:TRINITY_DN917_c0_g1_i3.p1 TRINITY_DN917_c0_g1~~TRINITY_DN917_c0_g1_i3.p1  ORF type:complete len:148 (-),score=10.33 TRINITY_DN917_c0_g1_i3:231-674(-)
MVLVDLNERFSTTFFLMFQCGGINFYTFSSVRDFKAYTPHRFFVTYFFEHTPSNTTAISYDDFYNSLLTSFKNLPHLRTITFRTQFDQSIEEWPQTLTSITFGSNFNRKLTNLPATVTELVFGANFTQNVDSLPPKLKKMLFTLFGD